MDAVVEKIIEWMFAQGGGYVIAIALGVVVYMLDKRLKEQRDINDQEAAEFAAQLKEQYEKRLDELRGIIDVMTNSTNTVTAMHNSLGASTDAINQLAAGFAKLMHEFTAQQARWDDRRGAMAKQLDEIQAKIEYLQRNAGRAA